MRAWPIVQDKVNHMKKYSLFLFLILFLSVSSCAITPPPKEIPEGKGYAYLHIKMQGTRYAELIVYEVGGGIPAAKMLVKEGEGIQGFFARPGKTYEIARIRFDNRLGFIRPPVTFGNIQAGRVTYAQSLTIGIDGGKFGVKQDTDSFARSRALFTQAFPEIASKYEFADSKE